MFKSYFKTAFRALVKHKSFSLINIIGLSIGIASFLFIALFIQFELSYENFILNRENIYRVTLDMHRNGELINSSAENYPGVGQALKEEIPEVKEFARLYNMGYKNNVVITYEDAPNGPISFKQKKFLYADGSFLRMFKYSMVAGDAETALNDPYKAVLSETYAKKYFGDENPIGKLIRLNDDDFNNELCEVTGVFKDIPANSHLKFDVLFSYKTLFSRGSDEYRDYIIARYDHGWVRKDMYVFLELAPKTNISSLENQFPRIVDKYNPEVKEQGGKDVISLQALNDIHLYSHLTEEFEPNGNINTLQFLGIIGLFILLIAWINYINLSTAKAVERANEVGVRKVMGAFKYNLMIQFMSESALVNLISIIIALMLCLLLLPFFNELAGLQIATQSLFQSNFIILVLGVYLVGSLLSGFYPSLVLSSYNPIVVMKGKFRNNKGGVLLRKVLVVFQFAASVVLVAGTIIVYQQMSFLDSQDIGMNIDQVLVVERPGVQPRDRELRMTNINSFRDKLNKVPGVKSIATSLTIPGKQRKYAVGIKKLGAPDEELEEMRLNFIDYDFIETFDMDILAGRNFSEDFPQDPDTSLIISEKAVSLLGWKKPEDALGQVLDIPEFNYKGIVVGVSNDYNQESLKEVISPTIFACMPYQGEYFSIKLQGTNIKATVNAVEENWKGVFPGNPFEYFFLDDYYNRLYQKEKRFGKLFSVFAMLAIIVGCLGLFGLSSFTAKQRTKEIGVRKVLGSKVSQIVTLLAKDFVILLTISNVIAWPIIYFSMDLWLSNFAYRTSLDPLVFIIAGFTVMSIALLSVAYQTYKAASIAPVKSLKYE